MAETLYATAFNPGRANGVPVATRVNSKVRVVHAAHVATEPAKLDRAIEPVAQERPKYPASIQSDGKVGFVTLRFTIGTDGQVANVAVARSNDPRLNEPVVAAVSRWKFKPCLQNGRPVAVDVVFPLRLSPDR